jgi:hypothetical protein
MYILSVRKLTIFTPPAVDPRCARMTTYGILLCYTIPLALIPLSYYHTTTTNGRKHTTML